MTRTWLFDALLACAVEKEGQFSGKGMMMVMNLSRVLQRYNYHAAEVCFFFFFPDCKHLGQIFILFETICLLISVCLIITVNDKCHVSYLAFSPYLLILCLWSRRVRIMCCALLNYPICQCYLKER